MNLAQVIRQRRSIRKFRDQSVPDAVIREVIKAATLAPSASNRQPWRFMIVKDVAVRNRLAACVQEEVLKMAGDVLPGFQGDFRSYSQHFAHFAQAPVLVLALCRSEATMADLFREGTSAHGVMRGLELDSASISVAMAVQNMLLSATEQGLGTCVMTGPLIAGVAIDRTMQVPDGWRILCMVSAGYPDETPGPTSRKSVDQVLIHPKTGDS